MALLKLSGMLVRDTIKTQDVSRIARFELHATMSTMRSPYSPNTLSTSLCLSLSLYTISIMRSPYALTRQTDLCHP